jgi:transcriptional regulator MraZ
MFIGHHSSTLDGKKRLALPADYKGLLAKGVYVTQGFDRNLLLLPGGAFEEIARRIKSMNIADPAARLLFRMILGSARRLEVDKNGCVLLPKELIEFANITEDALLIGQGEYFELWTPALWKEQEISLNNVEANSHRFASLTLCIA